MSLVKNKKVVNYFEENEVIPMAKCTCITHIGRARCKYNCTETTHRKKAWNTIHPDIEKKDEEN